MCQNEANLQTVVMCQNEANLQTVVMCLAAIVCAGSKLALTTVHGAVPHEAMLQGVVSLLVPLEVSNHLLLPHKHLHR